MSDNISEIVKRKMATTGTISPAPPEYQLCIHLGLTNSAAAIYWQHSGEYKFASVKDNEGMNNKYKSITHKFSSNKDTQNFQKKFSGKNMLLWVSGVADRESDDISFPIRVVRSNIQNNFACVLCPCLDTARTSRNF